MIHTCKDSYEIRPPLLVLIVFLIEFGMIAFIFLSSHAFYIRVVMISLRLDLVGGAWLDLVGGAWFDIDHIFSR